MHNNTFKHNKLHLQINKTTKNRRRDACVEYDNQSWLLEGRGRLILAPEAPKLAVAELNGCCVEIARPVENGQAKRYQTPRD